MRTKPIWMALLILAILMAACEKQELPKSNFQPTAEAVKQVQKWLEDRTNSSGYHQFMLDGKLVNIPQKIHWESTHANASTKTSITPVSFGPGSSSQHFNKFFVTKQNDAGETEEGNYYVVMTSNGHRNFPSEAGRLVDLLENKTIPGDFDGAIIRYNTDNKIVSAKHYEAGMLTTKTDKIDIRKSKNQVPVENTAPPPEGCSYVTIDWYWQVFENGVLVYEVYLYSTEVLYCTGGGGAGGGGGGTLTCEQQNELFVNQGSAISGQVTTVNESNNGTIWVRNYNWPIFTAGTWGLLSYEQGVLEKVQYPNNQERWEFQSFSHLRITEVGMNIGGTRSYTDLGATINFTQTRMSAWVRIDFSVSSKVFCWPNPVTIPYNSNKTFYAPNAVVYE